MAVIIADKLDDRNYAHVLVRSTVFPTLADRVSVEAQGGENKDGEEDISTLEERIKEAIEKIEAEEQKYLDARTVIKTVKVTNKK